MKIYPIEAGNFKLDGGAMFGVVPKTIWSRTNPADDNNMIDLATRCLLIENKDRLILIDTGMGNKQSEKFFQYYYRWGDFSLHQSLKKLGFHPNQITDVFLTHLHFDHCGGCIQWNATRTAYEPAFKNARFWTNTEHWNWALKPNFREKASFLEENLMPLQKSGQLHYIERAENQGAKYIEELGFAVLFVDGHTEKQMIPHIQYQGKTLVFVADLIPTVGHVPLAYVMGYDTRPLITLTEKKAFLEEAADKGFYLFLEHDAHHEIMTVKHTEKGVRVDEIFTFNELFNA